MEIPYNAQGEDMVGIHRNANRSDEEVPEAIERTGVYETLERPCKYAGIIYDENKRSCASNTMVKAGTGLL